VISIRRSSTLGFSVRRQRAEPGRTQADGMVDTLSSQRVADPRSEAGHRRKQLWRGIHPLW
jgi:hypothetical protein